MCGKYDWKRVDITMAASNFMSGVYWVRQDSTMGLWNQEANVFEKRVQELPR